MKKIVLGFLVASSLLFANEKPMIGNIDIKKMAEEKNIKELEELAKNNPFMKDINFMIGVYYMAGDESNKVKPDFKKAMSYFKKDENNLAMASYKIAELYYYGYGVEQDYKKSVEYFNKSIDKKMKDYQAVAPLSLLAIANIYLEKTKEESKAFEYLLRAAQEFDKVEAQMILGFLYIEGRGVKKDEKEANMWINKAYFNKNATGDHKAYISNFIEPVNSFNIENDVKNYCGAIN